MESVGILVGGCRAEGELAVENFEEVCLERDLIQVLYLIATFC